MSLGIDQLIWCLISNWKNVTVSSAIYGGKPVSDRKRPILASDLRCANFLVFRAVTESINHLINICTTLAPGQKRCDNALRQIQMMKNILDNPNEPVSDSSYFECLDGVMDRSKALGDAMTGISNHAKKGDLDEFCVSVKNFAAAVCGLTENASQVSAECSFTFV